MSGLIKGSFKFKLKNNRPYFFLATPDYVSLGCFDFQYLKKKNILGANLKSKPHPEPFETCSQIAKDRRVQKFGIRKKKGQLQCQMVEKEWYPNAKKSKKCKEKAGSGKSIFIYRKYLDSFVGVIYLDFHSAKRALGLVDSWSHAPDQLQMYPDLDTIAQLLPACRIQQHVISA